MDPEDIREIIRSYHSRVAETACRHNGLVAHTYGNTAVLCFGYPEAHEDDPERAVRAALELVAAVAALKPPTPLQTRVGIATSLVVVGEMTDAAGAQQHGIIGETPNIAAQLQALAEPNTAVIADSTRKLLGNLFDLQALGTKDLKGIVGPVRAWAACDRAWPQAVLRRCMTVGSLILSVGRKNLNCCCGAGRKQKLAKAK
jgi:class 3 adenylate cyclase